MTRRKLFHNLHGRSRTTLEFAVYLARRYWRDGCPESAAALTYMTLFALVPLLTLIYSVFTVVPAFRGLWEKVQAVIFSNFIPASGLEIQAYLMEFSDKARHLGSLGALLLVVTAYLMLANIEKTFNHIWNAAGHRRGLSAFLLYWGVLSLGPLLMGLGLLMHTYLISFRFLTEEVGSLGPVALMLEYLPWLLTWAAFTLLFLAVPNCKVMGRYAAIGGLVSAVLFELAKATFGVIVANTSFSSVYGAFAIVPLFLFWIYLCWMITLIGAELVRSLETFVSARAHPLPSLVAMVLILWHCWERQQKGQAVSDRTVNQVGIDQQQWVALRNLLLHFRFLVVTRGNRYVLTRDIRRVTLWQLVNMLGENFTRPPSVVAARQLEAYPWFEPFNRLVEASRERSRELLSVNLGDLFAGLDESTNEVNHKV